MSQLSRTILIVDDSPEDRELYRRYLLRDQDYHYSILEASLGQQGLELWQQQPDAVLLDYRLPDLDGLEFLAHLQSSTQPPCLPVIVVTGQGNEAIAVRAIKAGAQDYLVKGQITPEGLHLAVNGAIEAVRLRTQLQQRIEREHVIAQITQQIHQSLHLDSILQTVVTEVRQFLHTDRVLVFQMQPDGNGTVVAESVGSEWRSLLSTVMDGSCLAEHDLRFSRPESITDDSDFAEDDVSRYRQGQVTAIEDIHGSGSDRGYVEWLASLQVKANLVVPILHNSQLWGLLIAHHCSAPRSWETLEISLLKELATQLSIALRQVELHEQAQNTLAECKQTEVTLQKSEECFRQLAENIDVVFWIKERLEDRVSYVSPAYERLWGLDPQELYDRPLAWTDHIHPDDREVTFKAFQEKAAIGQFDQEYRLVLADGSIRWLRDRCFPLRDGAGDIYRFAGIAEDITARKHTENTLRESEERFRTSVENMLDCFGIYRALRDEQGQIVDFQIEYVNDAACLNNLLTREQQLGQRLCELLPGHRAIGLFDEYCQVVETGQPLVKDCLLYDKYGQQRLTKAFDIRIAKLGDGFIATWRDITDRKQTDEALQQSEERFRTLADNMSQFAWMADASGEIFWYNRRWFDYTGTTLEEMWGWNWQKVHHPDHVDRVVRHFRDCLETGTAWEDTFPLRAEDGSYRWFLSRAIPIKDEHDRVAFWFGTNTDIDDRKQAEEALRQSEERYRTLFESMEDSFCVIEMLFDEANTPIDYRFLEINPAFEQQTGLEQALGKTVRQLIPTLEEHWLETYGRVALTGEPVRFENKSNFINRWFDVYAFRIGQPENHKVAILFKDISDRKQAEEMMRWTAAQDAFRVSLTDELRSLDAPVEIQATASRILGEYLGANRVAYFQVRGTDYVVEHDYVNGAEALRGAYPIDLFGPRLLTAYRAGQVVCVADVAVDPNLSPTQRSAYAALQIAAHIGIPLVRNGKLVAGLTIHATRPRAWTPEEVSLATEVAERTWAAVERASVETALRASHETFRHLVENSPFGVYVVDADFRLAQVSTGAQKAFENVRPLLGRDFAEVMHLLWLEPFANETIAHFRHTLETGEPYHSPSTVERRHDTDEVESYDWKVERITLPDGRFGVVCHFYDLSERQQLLQREQAARAEAEWANQIKDEFLAVLSHELRSPLNPILGWVKLLQTRKFNPEKTAEALATIERNAKLQTQLIDDLLDVAKILRGKLNMETVPVDLVFVIEAAIDTVRAAAVAKEILLHPVLPQIGRVSGDAARLQQIIWNLLSNAIKFTPAKGQVEVRLERKGNQAKITVSDTGKGIHPEFLSHIFESFRQEDASTTRQYGGLGLGLAIARHLVEAQGGTIQADSPGEGLGATFTVQFPLLDCELEQPQPDDVSVDELDLVGVKILAVDDEPDARALLAVLLTQCGAKVVTVSSATEALPHLESFQPDVLISDIGMPEVDGYMLMRQIRALPPEKGGQVLAIALTAYAREGDHQQAINNGYQRHLTKPVDLDQLVQTVAELIRHAPFEQTTKKGRC